MTLRIGTADLRIVIHFRVGWNLHSKAKKNCDGQVIRAKKRRSQAARFGSKLR
jgi:hypothetical protein